MGAGGDVALPSLMSRLFLSMRIPAGPSAIASAGMPSREIDIPVLLFSLSMSTFSSSVICASRRAARSSEECDVFIHGQSCVEFENILVFSISFLLSGTYPRNLFGKGHVRFIRTVTGHTDPLSQRLELKASRSVCPLHACQAPTWSHGIAL